MHILNARMSKAWKEQGRKHTKSSDIIVPWVFEEIKSQEGLLKGGRRNGVQRVCGEK